MVDLRNIMGRIKKLPTLPEIYVRVSAMLDDENASSWDIGDAIKTDPSITSRILKVVNSAFYGLPQQIT
jgi:HD-like signal output (HDOD) protein